MWKARCGGGGVIREDYEAEVSEKLRDATFFFVP